MNEYIVTTVTITHNGGMVPTYVAVSVTEEMIANINCARFIIERYQKLKVIKWIDIEGVVGHYVELEEDEAPVTVELMLEREHIQEQLKKVKSQEIPECGIVITLEQFINHFVPDPFTEDQEINSHTICVCAGYFFFQWGLADTEGYYETPQLPFSILSIGEK